MVLIGMPGCGKSTVGRALARRQGKAFLDLDRLIEERAGKSIPAIFAQEGEEAFRTLESWAVREAGARTGCVISTGGGEERVLAVHRAGDLMGEASFFDQSPRVSSAIAVTECQVISVDGPRLEHILRTHPELALPLLRYPE